MEPINPYAEDEPIARNAMYYFFAMYTRSTDEARDRYCLLNIEKECEDEAAVGTKLMAKTIWQKFNRETKAQIKQDRAALESKYATGTSI